MGLGGCSVDVQWVVSLPSTPLSSVCAAVVAAVEGICALVRTDVVKRNKKSTVS